MQRKLNGSRGFPKEFRDKAVRLVNEGGYSFEQVAEKLGCSTESVRRWKEKTDRNLNPEQARQQEQEDTDNKRLRKRVAQLEMENEILKKATAYFAREIM
jgi:transposase